MESSSWEINECSFFQKKGRNLNSSRNENTEVYDTEWICIGPDAASNQRGRYNPIRDPLEPARRV